MSIDIDWSKAPEWANAVIRSNVGGEFFVSQWGGISARLRIGSSVIDEDSADMIPPHNWVLVETRSAPWTGEGLPPVGIEIEANMPAGRGGEYHWRRAKVVHGPLPGSDREVLVFDVEGTYPAWVDEFRPIRTPEQIAQQERMRAIEEMDAVFTSNFEGHRKDGLQALYDAGYRKQTAPRPPASVTGGAPSAGPRPSLA